MTIWNKSVAILGFATAMAFAGQAFAEDKMARPGSKSQVAVEVDEEEPTMWAGGSPDFCEACGGEVIDDPALVDPYEAPAEDAPAAGQTGNRSSDTLRGTCTQDGATAQCGN